MRKKFLPKKVKQKGVADFYNKEARGYDKIYASAVCKAEDKIITSLIAPHIKGKVIDVGCGTGFLLNYFSPKKYYGLDLSEKMIERARVKHPEMSFGIGDMNNIPFPENTFDTLVSLYGPMSYSLHPEKLLAEFSRVLVPSGKMIVMPYTKRAERNFFMGGYSTATSTEVRKTYYSSEMLRKLFNRCPYFKNVKSFGINYFANYLEYMAGEFDITYSSEFYCDLLSSELKNHNLPIEYARHALVIATKK